ncbi:hypothetical protein MTO96_011441 [Rhipicephalus appendiculatus]
MKNARKSGGAKTENIEGAQAPAEPDGIWRETYACEDSDVTLKPHNQVEPPVVQTQPLPVATVTTRCQARGQTLQAVQDSRVPPILAEVTTDQMKEDQQRDYTSQQLFRMQRGMEREMQAWIVRYPAQGQATA